MRRLLVAGIFGFALLASTAAGAEAADLISYPTSAGTQIAVSDGSKFDWNGFYAGVYGAYRATPEEGQAGLGIDFGVNTTLNYVLAGAEIAVEGLGGAAGETTHLEALGKAGVLVTDNALLYGTAGYGLDTGATTGSSALVGGGLEFAVSDSMTLRGQYLHGLPVSGGKPSDEITLGAQFHF